MEGLLINSNNANVPMNNPIGHDEIDLDSGGIPGSGQEFEDSTGESRAILPTEGPGRLDAASMSVSSLFANLFTDSADGLGFLPEGDFLEPRQK